MMVFADRFAPRRILTVGLLLLLFCPSMAWSLSTSVELETMLRGFEREIPQQGTASVRPAYGYLKLDLKDITSNGISFHGYGWGRYDLADSAYYGSRSDNEVVYGYFEYRKKFSSLRARLGRMHLFEGVANETLDGLWLAGDLAPRISLSGYAGQPVGLASTNERSGDNLFGGRASYHGGDRYDIGLSFKGSDNDSQAADRMIGGDLFWALPREMSLFGFSKYNTETSNFAEHAWELRVPFDEFSFKPYLEYYDYDSYFGTGDKAMLPFRNLASSGESLGILGLDASWRKSEAWNLGAKLKLYGYDQNDSSQYLAGLVTFSGEEKTQTGGELGYMLGDAANNDYLLLRLFTYQDRLTDKFWISFLSADLVYVHYSRAIYNKDSSLFMSLGAGKTFWDEALDLKLSGDYSADPYYNSDLRGMLSATFYFGRGY